MNTIILYTKNNCPACDTLKRRLNLKDLEFDTVNIETDEKAYALIVSKGFRSVPVFRVNNDFASGAYLGAPELRQLLDRADQIQAARDNDIELTLPSLGM